MRQTKYLDLAADYGFELRRGTGRFVDEATLSVDGEPLTAGSYLIATGAHPAVPPIDGLAADRRPRCRRLPDLDLGP